MSRRYSRDSGPIRTFEENFMAYLLMNNGDKAKGKKANKGKSLAPSKNDG